MIHISNQLKSSHNSLTCILVTEDSLACFPKKAMSKCSNTEKKGLVKKIFEQFNINIVRARRSQSGVGASVRPSIRFFTPPLSYQFSAKLLLFVFYYFRVRLR